MSAPFPEQKGATQDSGEAQRLEPRPQPHETGNEEVDGEDGEGEGEIDEDRGIIVRASDMTEEMLQKKKKKKKKKSKKPASKRGLGKPTGFEEFHADAPLTPEQYLEFKEAFSPDIPFVDRILKAIQRFERTRKLSPERQNIFYKYLAYGGVDVGPNMFVGGQNTEDMDKDEITTTMARANISEQTRKDILDPKQDQPDKEDSSAEPSILHSPEHMAKYVVDFMATMRSFLSRRVTSLFVFDTQDDVSIVTTTLERFMDYLLQHDVCPEYRTEIFSTRDLCRTARAELWDCVQAQRRLPGAFNTACSTLFGSVHLQQQESAAFGTGSPAWDTAVTTGMLTPEKATQIIGFAIAGAATEQVYEQYLEIINATTGSAIDTSTATLTDHTSTPRFELTTTITGHGFEIIRIQDPSRECLDLYRRNTTDFSPVGTIHARFFYNPDAPPEDHSDSESDGGGDDHHHHHAADQFTFFAEQDILRLLQPGTRVEATVHRLNCGVWFFDEVRRVLPSFDFWCENELLVGWKEPRWIEGAGAVDYYTHTTAAAAAATAEEKEEEVVPDGAGSDEADAVADGEPAADHGGLDEHGDVEPY